VPYAIAVFQRRQELYREREAEAMRLAEARGAARKALRALGEAIVETRDLPGFEALAAPLAGVDRAAGTGAESEGARAAALVHLAEEARARRLDDSVGAVAEACEVACRARDERHREVEMSSRALEAHDPSAYRTGATLLGALGAVVLAALVAMIVR